ncbi:MarR family winged helix-turn-helix transcriptional regulator [Nodosilinea nodulosa]|uniref:MarR family winged helix-turn-helix transcriptional regulator n=1 Tax=Nodosilinea nodulosa TaxID=416001 RepID=UPI0002FCE017|nr:MarR family transcriptional regulator [Nodosilinea nodulosa]
MSSRPPEKGTTRDDLLAKLAQVGRENSDATVIYHAAMAQVLGLPLTDYKTMSVLERLGPLSAGEIARHTGLATASVTNLIDRLERKGFVRRVHDRVDRRRVLVEPVAEQVAEAHLLFASTRQSLAHLYENYSDEELAVIADFLARNAERLRTEAAKLYLDQP